MTRAAPCWRRQSVKPPVDEPTSRHVLPSADSPGPHFSNAPSSFSPPRETKRGGASTSTDAAASIWRDGLYSVWPATRTFPSITSAWACVRLAASPLSTIAMSSRFFTSLDEVQLADLGVLEHAVDAERDLDLHAEGVV